MRRKQQLSRHLGFCDDVGGHLDDGEVPLADCLLELVVTDPDELVDGELRLLLRDRWSLTTAACPPGLRRARRRRGCHFPPRGARALSLALCLLAVRVDTNTHDDHNDGHMYMYICTHLRE